MEELNLASSENVNFLVSILAVEMLNIIHQIENI
jgi:hypothetical protein